LTNYKCEFKTIRENIVAENKTKALYKYKGRLRLRPHTPEKFENGVLTLKTHETFSVHTTPGILNLCSWKTRAGKSQDYRVVIVFENLRFQNVFCPHSNAKPAFSNSSGLKSLFEKFRFRDGISVDGRPNRRSKAAVSNFSGVMWTGPEVTMHEMSNFNSSEVLFPQS